MFALFERLLQPTDTPRTSRAAARADRVLLAFRPPGQGPVRRAVRGRLRGGAARFADPGVHRPRRHPDHLEPARAPVRDLLAASSPAMALVLLVLRPLALTSAEHHGQPGDRRQCRQPDPLAEPLARGAAELDLLPERFRRPHRQPGDADRAGDPREPGRAADRRLVHPGLRHQRVVAAGQRRPLAGAADRALVRRLSGDAAHLRAAHARPLQDHVGGALAGDRADRRQLHQHPDRQAVRPPLAGGRLCARGARPAHRHVPCLAAAQHAVRPDPVARSMPRW